MSASINLRITENGATPSVRKLGERLGGRILHEAIGAGLLSALQTHFDRRAQEPNKLGGPKVGFWERISVGSFATATETEAVVTVPAPILQKLYGGTIKPVNAKAIAFPVSPRSYGKSAREMRGEGLTKYIPIVSKKNPDVIGIIRAIEGPKVLGETLFLVMLKVTQPKDPNAIPSPETLMKAAMDAVEESADALLN